MLLSNRTKWNQYLLYFILATLPLERIPALSLNYHLHATIRLDQVAGLLLILLNLPVLWQKREQWFKTPWRFAGLFLVVAFVSSLLATHHVRSLSVWVFTTFAMLLAWTVSLVIERDRLKTYAAIIVTSAVAVCLFGLYQFFGDLLGLSTAWTGLRPEYTSLVFGFPRIQSTGLEPLYFDNYLLIPLGILLAALIQKVSWQRVGAFVFIGTILFANVSRGAEVAFITMTLVALGWTAWKRRWNRTIWLGAAILTCWVLALGLIALGTHFAVSHTTATSHAVANLTHQEANLDTGESAMDRSTTRRLAFQAFNANPVLGLGPGNFGYYAHIHEPRYFTTNTAIVNNEPVEILAETGIIGFVAFAAFVIELVLFAWSRLPKLSGEALALGGGLALALIGIAIQYQLFSTLYITYIWVAIGLLIGLVFGAKRSPKPKSV